MSYGNNNLLMVKGAQYITFGAASDSTDLHPGTIGVTLRTSEDCWININAAAAAPGAEKTFGSSFPLRADESIDIAVPWSTDASPVSIHAIQDSTTGTLDIIERGE